MTDKYVQTYRAKHAALGRKPRQFFLTDQEFMTMKRMLEQIRSKSIEEEKIEENGKNDENQ
jgi:hypothetical protein